MIWYPLSEVYTHLTSEVPIDITKVHYVYSSKVIFPPWYTIGYAIYTTLK